MTSSPKLHRDIVLSLVAIAVVLRVLLVLKAPAFGYVWDFYHEGVRILAEQGRLPVAADCWQCYHPPFFYLAGWPFYAVGHWWDPASPTLPLRTLGGVSLVSAGLVTWYGYRLMRLVGLAGWWLTGGTAILLVSPLLFISAYGPEADIVLSAILGAFLFHLTRSSARPMEQWAMREVLVLGVLAGLAAATKYSGLVAIVTAGVMTGLALLRSPRRWVVVRYGATMLLVAVVIGHSKYVENVRDHGTWMFANGSASAGLSLGVRENRGGYEFTTVRLAELRALFGPRPEAGDLTTFPVYRSVVTSLHAQLWSDMSFFSVPSRHGAPGDPYPRRRVPVALVMAVIVLGFVPEVLAVVGLGASVREPWARPLIVFGVVTLAAYVAWFLPQESWALKTKYILCLLPPMVVFAMAGQAWMWRVWRPLGWVTAALVVALVAIAHVYLLAFAAGRL